MNFLADKSYLAVKPQVDIGVALIPDIFIPLISESIKVNPNYMADRRMAGLDWKSDDLLKGPRTVEGDISVYGDPDAIAHMFNMAYEKGVTTGDAASGYTHPFLPGEGKHYTLEISRGIYAQRIFGARADKVKLEYQDNKLVANVSIKALGQFSTVSLAVALTGAGMTSAVFKTNYDLRPADGLKVGDTIIIGGVEITLSSINANGTTVGFGATTVTAGIGDPVYLKAQTPTYGVKPEPLYLGNALVGVAATSAAADTAAGAKATAIPCYDISQEFSNNLTDAQATGSYGPAVLLNQIKEAALGLSRLFETPLQFQKWLEYVKQAVTIINTGRYIDTALTISEKLTIKYHKVKALENDEPLEVGKYIFDKQKFEVLYDSGESKSVELTIVNRTSGDDLGDDES